MMSLVFVLIAYLLGSLSFAVIVSRLLGMPDPRTFGSKNPGATNVLRTGKKMAAALTLLGDALKGWAAVFLAMKLGPGVGVGDYTVAAVVVAVFLGHIFPVFFGFQGGKGVATALGILLALHPLLGAGVLGTWLLAAYMWRISSLSALIAAGFAPLYAGVIFGFHIFTAAVSLLSILLVWRHRSNIRKLLAGRESAIGAAEQAGDSPPK